jgi:divalent metal cation (Fe/Co/Zn/Cd) transporter
MDAALPPADQDAIRKVLAEYEKEGVRFHALRTRQAGSKGFVSVHVLVPGEWTVHAGHQFVDRIELDVRKVVPGVHVTTHLESLDDPASYADEYLEDELASREAESPRG